MKNLLAITAFTLLTSTAWADADSIDSKGGMDEVHKHSPASQVMDPAIRENMMKMREQKMGKGMQGGMMNPQMMQMRQEHMKMMKQKLSSIESLLQQLVEQQKGK